MVSNVSGGTNRQIIDIDFDSVKNEKLRDLEVLCCDELVTKVKELAIIVDNIEENWRGANAEKYRQEINDIIDAIYDFKNKCLEPNISDINAQVDTYMNNEKAG